MKSIFFILLLVLGAVMPVTAQLADFSLTLVAKDETCEDNGGVTISVSGTTPGATMNFTLLSLPDETPIDTFTQTFYQGLDAGTYRIVATQVLGSESNTRTADFTVADLVEELTYTVSESSNGNCAGNSGNLTVNVLTGVPPFSYEITSGPLTFPPQSSNTFSNLPAGQYVIRVTDACKSIPLTHTLVSIVNSLTVTSAGHVLSTDCLSIEVMNSISASPPGVIVYPLQVTYRIHFPDGTEQTLVQSYPSGDPDGLDLTLTLPLFGGLIYDYDLDVIDGCGDTYTGNFVVNPNPKPVLTGTPNECGFEYLTLLVSDFVGSYTMQFLPPLPAGFDPATLNPSYPGPTTNGVLLFGDSENPVPEGTYVIEVVDSCGRSGQVDYVYTHTDPDPSVRAGEPNCLTNLANIRFQVAANRDIVTIIVTGAPPEYTPSLPNDVSPALPGTNIVVPGFPPNPAVPYVFTIIDECGVVYTGLEEFVEPFEAELQLGLSARPSCTPNFGSLEARSLNGNLTTLVMTAAPENFTGTIPFDATSMIASGKVMFPQLPPGDYSFTATDACGLSLTGSATVSGYKSGDDNVVVVRNCGSFDFRVSDTGNILGVSYWWQRRDPVTGIWGHPETGAPYAEGTIPDATNAIQVANLSTVYNRHEEGTFRILKIYQTYNGSATDCIDASWDTFSFSRRLDVANVYLMDCQGASPGTIYVEAVGVPPYHYTITGPMTIDNGNDPVFTGLVPGTYFLTVTDACGGAINGRVVNLSTLQSLVVAHPPQPSELLECVTPGTTTHIFDLTVMQPSILGNQPVTDYELTYHLSESDADAGINPIPTPQAYVNTSMSQSIYVRVMHRRINACYDTTSFRLVLGNSPPFTVPRDHYFLCAGDSVRIFAGGSYDAYLWSDGSTAPYLEVTEPGTYTVTVANVYGSSRCESEPQTITVTGSSIATITGVEVRDWRQNNSLTILVTGTGDYTYSIDGASFQPSDTFDNLIPGIYTVWVRDENGCGLVSREVAVLGYPKYFTPNADGHNDYWHIKFAHTLPGMMVYIFNRYGKLLTSLSANASGWDGTYNGRPVPSDDYWFLVELPDGKTHRGHFALKR